MQAPPERLGSFFLGAEYDLDKREVSGNAVNYDARDLTTHAVVVGMTGSGKTGLCVGLLEEAALDKVPAIIIDPKGDMTNLLLQFPDLAPTDFAPWINPDDARRKDKTVEEFAESTASLWQNGLQDWGVTPERIRTLLATTDYTVFTPGSDAGIPINVLGSLAAPKLDFATHSEAVRERIAGTVAALLGLIDVKSDPLQGQEAILLANIFEHFWKQNEDLDLPKLIMAIQTPPVRQIGVFDVDTFYPQKERFGLAMAFNNLMASPNFKTWLDGEPLDIDTLYYTPDGQPRHSIFYIAHLSDRERMFFVTLLLENLVTWMRAQTGTTSLRALLYFDEIFGFFPPSAEPSSKRPLLTLLKQARAFGLGTVLVTQNPVDIDYKGLTNAGTWFIGKLQAERDKDRLLSGLKGAIAEAGSDAKVDYDELISRLDSRVFLLHNVHADGPVVMHTRWAQSYLRGPLTRPQVRQLMKDRVPAPAPTPAPTVIPATAPSAGPLAAQVAADVTAAPSTVAAEQIPAGFTATPPALDPDTMQVFLPIEIDDRRALEILERQGARIDEIKGIQLTYEAGIVGMADVRYVDRTHNIDKQTQRRLLLPAPDRFGVDWEKAEPLSVHMRELGRKPEERLDPGQGPYFAAVPETINSARELRSVEKDFSDWLYYNSRLPISVHEDLELAQSPDERERDFKIRLQQAARERRDADVDKLEEKFAKTIDRLQTKLTKEERELAADKADFESRRMQEWTGIGESVVGYFLGRKSSRAISSAMSKRRMTAKAQLDIQESEEEINDLKEEMAALEQNLKEETEAITLHYAQLLDELTTVELKPRRTDVAVDLVTLAWIPTWLIRYDDGLREREVPVAAYAEPAVG